MGGAGGLITYVVASMYRQAAAPKPSATSLQERASLVAELGEVEGCASTGIYVAPNGGGGATSAIRVNGQVVNFGHGSRHLEGTG